ncbi:metallophosphoesterase [Candidatus Daviesbacteria bacterium]|nr:metallophosphoesterase [Candidatus Daviesbacteria bacterium]
MFRRHHGRHRNPVYFIFRLILSLTIFAILVGGIYSAYKQSLKTPFGNELSNAVYKQFSGIDLIKASPENILGNFTSINALTNFFRGLVNKKEQPSENTKFIPVDKKEVVKTTPVSKPKFLFKFAMVSDSHSENDYLKKALNQAQNDSLKPEFVIGLGDYTEVGTLQEMQNAKKEFDSQAIRYFLTVGDHDLWDSRDKQKAPTENFSKIFGSSYQSFNFQGVKFIILDNSDNYQGISQPQMEWLKEQLRQAKTDEQIKLILAFLHEPLYHPSATRVMGKVNQSLKEQAREVAKMLKEAGVKEVFAGDIHYFTRYNDPETGLSMTTVGAVASQRNAQLPRFAIVEVFDDFKFNVEDIEIK